jgi:uncharacterized protein involved in tolerance to divalent cations
MVVRKNIRSCKKIIQSSEKIYSHAKKIYSRQKKYTVMEKKYTVVQKKINLKYIIREFVKYNLPIYFYSYQLPPSSDGG